MDHNSIQPTNCTVCNPNSRCQTNVYNSVVGYIPVMQNRKGYKLHIFTSPRPRRSTKSEIIMLYDKLVFNPTTDDPARNNSHSVPVGTGHHTEFGSSYQIQRVSISWSQSIIALQQWCNCTIIHNSLWCDITNKTQTQIFSQSS